MLLAEIAYPPLTEHVSKEQLAQLDEYAQLLTSEAMPAGYIGECSPDEVKLRHVLDSILPAIAPESRESLPLVNGASLSVFDLGAGAGLPSLPLAILFPQHRFFLLDAQEKRCRFAVSAAERLGLKNVMVTHGVVQNFEKPDKADVVVFRAFRKILASLELALHVLRTSQQTGVHPAPPKVLYWRSQRVPFSERGFQRVDDLGFHIDAFVKFTSAEAILPRGLYTFSYVKAAKKGFPRSWKKISADSLVDTES